MKFDENLVAIHAYLCGDGYVTKHKPGGVKSYNIGFRNTNLVLLKDFQSRFYNCFGVKPNLYVGERCHKGSREIYEGLTKEFGSFYSREWSVPELSGKLMGPWLSSFFDCEGWVFCKSHQNRHIGLDSVNEKGLDQVIVMLNKLGINSIKKVNEKRKIFRIFIYGKENLIMFRDKIGFLHPEKRDKLNRAILDYVDYFWNLEKNEDSVRKLMLEKAKVKKPYLVRVISCEIVNLRDLKLCLCSLFGLDSDFVKLNECVNGIGTSYFELSVNRKEEVEKLVRKRLINGIQLQKIDRDKFVFRK